MLCFLLTLFNKNYHTHKYTEIKPNKTYLFKTLFKTINIKIMTQDTVFPTNQEIL